MKIAGYLKTSLIEWPGKIASVIFVPGCNFRCPFCHNRDLVDPSRITRLQEISEQLFFVDLEKRRKWVDAVVIGGGEPTLQPDLPRFIKKAKDMGFLVMLQTNGTRPDVINGLIINKLTDYFAMDVKGDLENYSNYSNVQFPIRKIKESIKLVAESGVGYEFRTTVVPGLHDLENLEKLATELKFMIHNSKFKIHPKWFLQKFRPVNTLDPKFMKVEPYTDKQMEAFQKKLQKIFPHIYLRGVL